MLIAFICLLSPARLKPAPGAHRIHLEIGANDPSKQLLQKRYGVGSGTTAYLFEPQPRFQEVCRRKAAEMGDGSQHLPYAAWVRNATLPFAVHEDLRGIGSSLYNRSVYAAKGSGRSTVSVQALDLAEWMERTIPRDNVFLTAHLDVEGAEYALMRRLMLTGQACRFSYLEFEGHAMMNADHAPLRAFDVLLPWLLAGCERPPAVRVVRFYGTPQSIGGLGRIDEWTRKVPRESWCADCKLLDELVDRTLGDAR